VYGSHSHYNDVQVLHKGIKNVHAISLGSMARQALHKLKYLQCCVL
jgi:hypothetical protein